MTMNFGNAETQSNLIKGKSYMELLTTAEVAQILRLSANRVRQLCEDGTLPARRTAITKGQWRIDKAALFSMLSTPTVPVNEPAPEIEREQIDWGVFEAARHASRHKPR